MHKLIVQGTIKTIETVFLCTESEQSEWTWDDDGDKKADESTRKESDFQRRHIRFPLTQRWNS